MADRERVSRRTTKISGNKRTTIVEGNDSKHGSFYSRTDVVSSKSHKGRWGYVIRNPKLIFGGMTAFFFLVMIFSFIFAKFMDLPWYQTFWKSYTSYAVNGWDPVNHVMKEGAESKTWYYFDVFSYLKNLGNGTDWARYLFSDTSNAFNTLAPEHWSVLNALIFSINIIIFILNLIQFPVKFGCVLLMYSFAIFGFTPQFPLWGFCEWIITKWQLPMIPYLYE